MNRNNTGKWNDSILTTSYVDDPYGIRQRTEDRFIPPDLEHETAYTPNEEIEVAKSEAQKRIVRRKLRKNGNWQDAKTTATAESSTDDYSRHSSRIRSVGNPSLCANTVWRSYCQWQ